ncbi:MAG: hypothetical protein WAX07_06610 [Candidatus Altiarchaeia archaeon]
MCLVQRLEFPVFYERAYARLTQGVAYFLVIVSFVRADAFYKIMFFCLPDDRQQYFGVVFAGYGGVNSKYGQ